MARKISKKQCNKTVGPGRCEKEEGHKTRHAAGNEFVEDLARKFLVYAFEEIDFEYSFLTSLEKALCSSKEFKRLVRWIAKEKE